jgi:hypothetical protein
MNQSRTVKFERSLCLWRYPFSEWLINDALLKGKFYDHDNHACASLCLQSWMPLFSRFWFSRTHEFTELQTKITRKNPWQLSFWRVSLSSKIEKFSQWFSLHRHHGHAFRCLVWPNRQYPGFRIHWRITTWVESGKLKQIDNKHLMFLQHSHSLSFLYANTVFIKAKIIARRNWKNMARIKTHSKAVWRTKGERHDSWHQAVARCGG